MRSEREVHDYQFNPAFWTPRIDPDDFVPSHVEYATGRSEAYRGQLSEDGEFRTITYGSGAMEQRMDVFRPLALDGNASIVVYIHGGWWQWFSKDMFSYVAEPFNRAGYAVYMPGYTLAQDWHNDSPMESIVEQLELAIVKVFEEAEATSAKDVILVGHSAGGHLVSLLRKTDWTQKYGIPGEVARRLSSVFSLAGLFDLRPLVNSYVNDEIGMTRESAERVSPMHVPPNGARQYPALHLILPEFDSAEFFRQTKEYQQKLLMDHEKCHLKVLVQRDHISMIESIVNEGDELMTHMLDHMRT